MNDEDVAAWREERRKNWPTTAKGEAHREKLAQKRRRIATVEARKREEYELERVFRQEAKEEARARAAAERERRAAERAADNAESRPKRAGKARRNKDPSPFPRWSDDSEDEDTCDGIPMFRGTARFSVPERCGEDGVELRGGGEITAESFAISDDEIMGDEETASPKKTEALKVVIVDDDDDSEPPEEIKVKKEPVTALPVSSLREISATPTNPITTTERKNLPQQRKKLDEESLPPQMALRRRIFRLRMRQTWRQEGPAPSTLLERLLQKDIETERAELLQCVKYVCENNFFGIGGSQKQQEENTFSQPGSESGML